MSLTEYNEAEFIENRRNEGREEGRAEERTQIILKLLNKGKSCEEIADLLDISLEEVKILKKK